MLRNAVLLAPSRRRIADARMIDANARKVAVRWTLMFRVATRDEAEREMTHVQNALGVPLRMMDCERYWKIPELWSCGATMEIETTSIADCVTRSLLLANRLAIGWYVLGPYVSDDGTALESFEGIYTIRGENPIMPLLEWAQFEVG